MCKSAWKSILHVVLCLLSYYQDCNSSNSWRAARHRHCTAVVVEPEHNDKRMNCTADEHSVCLGAITPRSIRDTCCVDLQSLLVLTNSPYDHILSDTDHSFILTSKYFSNVLCVLLANSSECPGPSCLSQCSKE